MREKSVYYNKFVPLYNIKQDYNSFDISQYPEITVKIALNRNKQKSTYILCDDVFFDLVEEEEERVWREKENAEYICRNGVTYYGVMGNFCISHHTVKYF